MIGRTVADSLTALIEVCETVFAEEYRQIIMDLERKKKKKSGTGKLIN